MDGLPWTDARRRRGDRGRRGPGARLVRDESEHRFDVLPLLVATDGAIAAFGTRRSPLAAQSGDQGCLGIGRAHLARTVSPHPDVLIALVDLRGRCVMTTFDPDSLQQNPQVLRDIVDRFDGRLALNASVAQSGHIHEGDPVELLTANECTATGSP